MTSTLGTVGASVDTSFAARTQGMSKAAPAQLVSLRATNLNAAIRYIQIYDTINDLTGAPKLSEPIPAGATASPASLILDSTFFGNGGLGLAKGLTWGISTTQSTFTAATAADHSITVLFF